MVITDYHMKLYKERHEGVQEDGARRVWHVISTGPLYKPAEH